MRTVFDLVTLYTLSETFSIALFCLFNPCKDKADRREEDLIVTSRMQLGQCKYTDFYPKRQEAAFKRPCFAPQKAMNCNVKCRLSQCKRRHFGKVSAANTLHQYLARHKPQRLSGCKKPAESARDNAGSTLSGMI